MVNIILIVLAIAAFVGMIICNKKQQTNPNAQGIALVLLLVVIVSGGFFMYNNGYLSAIGIGSDPEVSSEIVINKLINKSQGYKVGKFIQENATDADVLVIAMKDYKNDFSMMAIIDGIKESGIPDSKIDVQEIDYVQVGMNSFGSCVTPKDFDNLTKASSAKAIVNTVGFPEKNADRMEMLKRRGAEKPLIVNVYRGTDKQQLASLLNNGKLAGEVREKPVAVPATLEPNMDKIFEEFYVLYTKENANSIK